MGTTLESIKTKIERWRFWRTWLGVLIKNLFGIGQRYGVRYTSIPPPGQPSEIRERSGFLFRKAAQRWGNENSASFEVYDYSPAVDLRLRPDEETEHGRDRFSDRPPAG
ncbi:MAG TPA: hypothetical protein VK524_04045 [Polyangiaceae bacterium]|nr:hypothetical protein [Polyangiaceae bacterium]